MSDRRKLSKAERRKEFGGPRVSRVVHMLDVNNLRELGMVERHG